MSAEELRVEIERLETALKKMRYRGDLYVWLESVRDECLHKLKRHEAI